MVRLSEQANYYRVTIKDSTNMDEIKTGQWGDIQIVFGKENGSYYIQSLLLPKSTYTEAQAKIHGFLLTSIFKK